MSDTKVAAVAFVQRPEDQRILAVYNKRYGGWSMPGGMVEEGELPIQAVVRELCEETGLDVATAEPFPGDVDLVYSGSSATAADRSNLIHVYRVTPTDYEPEAREDGCPVAWFTAEELLDCTPFTEFYREIYKALGMHFCPRCNSELVAGYGLAGGGIGPYFVCDNDRCDYFSKTPETETTS